MSKKRLILLTILCSLIKLQILEIRDQTLSWLIDYLKGRHQQVQINNHTSGLFPVILGVLRGEHISSLHFILYINDIKHVLKWANVSLFADDLKLYNAYYAD